MSEVTSYINMFVEAMVKLIETFKSFLAELGLGTEETDDGDAAAAEKKE